MAVQIQLRRATAAEWALEDPVLAAGEPGLETDTRKVKYGDGVSQWNSLSYSQGGVGADGDPGADGSTVVLLEVAETLPEAGTYSPNTIIFRKSG